MTELVRAQPAFKVDFVPSLGLDLLSTMGLIGIVHDFEGLDAWLVEAAASVPPRLRHDIQLAMRLGVYPYVVVETVAGQLLAPGAAGHDDFNGLIDDLKALSAQECAAIVHKIVQRTAANADIELLHTPAEIIADQEQLEELLAKMQFPVDTEELIELLQQPTEWRDLLVSTIQRFWDRIYREQYELQQARRERNAHYHRTHQYSVNFRDLFAGVTGRRLPDHIHERLSTISTVRFVPSQYIGPYLSFLFNNSLLTVFYNSSTTPAEGDEQTERTQSLYQPLAALADKTRLQIMTLLHGRELYAQEIVNLLDIHQSAVSRHLKLMETSGVLNVRRDKGAKYYSINRQRIEEISARLREFV
ncbi:ArsR/SmtB family transcription factor [Herpetosiphon giganteus]|uniref:ArsR/SmtB family transcription factor n=1 Tax=Herpetosiphon giganteus TaxID=2029754 RepID=UPI00195BFF0B|nr:metalloregulator ArsR/SmtB family transcription factor [Herpetosiphon giganteus]MBM7845329.1 DNA-binding transcriptional ArsR family regulator [Herpetosiphon giganteus]